ncbi:fanconi-associated nuclease 1-like [Palaemon carinicauda]|uniref:fanconi-associated nuclease 1-like n=1 Tax=Palaemon carinicauda TaxID=392227 RepID=UPI0035B5AF79
MKRLKKNDNSSDKPQKTIIDFFRRQSTEPKPAVVIITCPGCFLEVPESKINWHLDQDCKSRERPKKKKDGNLAKRKKILKSVKNEIANKKKQKVMLSDSEEDDLNMSDDSDVRIIEYENVADNEPYITPSMVETHIFEIEKDLYPTSSTCQSSSFLSEDQNVSPYCSPVGKNTKIKMENELIGSPQHRIASLQADWESPCLTPGKENTLSNIENPVVEEILEKDSNKSLLTPSRLSLNKRKTELLVDTGLDEMEDYTYQATPLKHSKDLSKSQSNLFKESVEEKEKCKIVSGKSSHSFVTSDDKFHGDSDDDFEKPIHFRTPDKLLKKRLKCTFGSEKKNKTSGVVSPVASKVSLSPVSGPADVTEAFSAPFVSSNLASLETSPRPTINRFDCTSDSSEKKEEHIRKLFPTSTESSHDSICESKASSCKVSLSQDIKSGVNRFSKIDKERVFDALLNTASQSQNSDIPQSQGSSHMSSKSQDQTSQGEEKKRLWVRTPRKINQSIKSTGILQSSPQNVSKNFIAKRRSVSLSPQKQSQSPNKHIGNPLISPTVSEVLAENKYDKSIFRGHKGYYLENFLLIMTTVLSEPFDLQLFNEEDLSFVKSFHKLSLQAQKLYVRLFQRKLKWNRVSKLDYRDICDQEDMELYIKELSYASFLRLSEELCDPNEVLQLLTAEEVKNLCKQIRISTSGKKEDLITSLLNFNKCQPSVLSAFSKKSSENCVILKQAKELLGQSCLVNKDVYRVFMRIIMLYGLPRYDDEDDKVNHTQLTTLLMVNLGKMKFPKYDVVRQHSIFQSREELIRFEGCSQILSDLHDCLEKQQWEESVQYCELAKVTYQELINNEELIKHDLSLPTFLRCYTSMSVLVYIISCSVECYQRLKNYRKAVEQLRFLLNQTSYLQDYRGRWYDRLALNLEVYLKSPVETFEVIKEALNDPEVRVGHRLSLSIRAQRMAASPRFRSLAPDILELPLMKPREAPKVIIEGRSLPGDAGYKKVFIRQDSDRHAGEGEVTVCSVEELALNHYKSLGYSEGLHHEGSTVRSLFGFFFWDILYSSVPDVFRSPHQAAPVDLNDPHFYVARKNLIEEKLSLLERYTEEQVGAELERIWNEHTGTVAMVDWNLFRSLEYVKGLVLSLKLPVVASICRRLALDHRFTRSGFPDLIVWNPDKKESCIVEVKGPNDRLSTKQILWLDYLLEHGAVAEVCHVEDSSTKFSSYMAIQYSAPEKETTMFS